MATPTKPIPLPPCAVIGGGTMASAILRGAGAAGLLTPEACVVADPDPARRAAFPLAVESGDRAIDHLADLDRRTGSGFVLLAVKPQALAAAAEQLRPALDRAPAPRTVISILAGVTTDRLRRALGPNARVVRVMPNTPAAIGHGMSAVATAPGGELAMRLLASLGRVIELDESLMDAFTALAGSGPAYLFYLAEAMVRGAIAAGIPEDQADLAARQTLLGAAQLLVSDPSSSPAQLRAAVTSKRGVTAAAIESMDHAGVMHAVAAALLAARDRGRELAREA